MKAAGVQLSLHRGDLPAECWRQRPKIQAAISAFLFVAFSSQNPPFLQKSKDSFSFVPSPLPQGWNFSLRDSWEKWPKHRATNKQATRKHKQASKQAQVQQAQQVCTMQTTTSELEPHTWRRSELDARARVMRAAPASAGASASTAAVAAAAAAAAAAVYLSSPMTVSSCKSTSSASRFSSAASLAGSAAHAQTQQPQQQPRSTRALLSRLFRSSKSTTDSPRCDSDGGDEEQQQQHGATARERRRHASDAHSPILASSMNALHLHEQRTRHESLGDQLLDSSFYYSQQEHQEQQQSDGDGMRRRESEPAQRKNNYSYYQQQLQQASKQYRSGSYPVAVERFPTRKILIQGYLTKLSTHKYWHAKPSYFVLEECIVAPATTLQVTLRQFRKQEDARMAQSDPLALSEIVLSEDDVVVDISNRHTKHGFELLFSAPDNPQQQQVEPAPTTESSIWSAVAALASSSSSSSSSSASASAHNHNRQSSFGSSSATVVRSLRLAAPDALALESWIAVLGSAIAKLIFQSTKLQQQLLHYPSGHATTTTTATLPNKFVATAKVAPIVSENPDDDEEEDDDVLKEEIRQAEQQQQQQQNDQDDADGDDNDEEEKPRRPNGYHAVSQFEPEQQRDCDSVDIEQGLPHKPLRRCPSCYQWMPYDCDDGEQTSCCSCEGSEEDEEEGEYNGSDNNSNNFHHGHGRRRDGSYDNQEDNQSDNFASSSSATSFTPSDSPNDPFERAATFDQETTNSNSSSKHSANNLSRHHAFSNFIVSPNPPVQITGSSSLSSSSLSSYSPTVASYPNRTLQGEQHVEDLESELKASSLPSSAAALARVSSGATAFLRSRFARANHSVSSAYQRPPMHSFTANGQVFTLDTRYKLVKPIGTGAYGAVIAVSDAVADCSVAVKKITNIFEDLVDAKRILREVRLLHHFHHKNITKLLDLSPPISKKQFEDMYIITELMETDLHQVIYSMQPMSDDHVKYFLYQMLCALHHIHSAGVIHRDMKPSNVLLNSNCDLKICDFGLARGGVPPSSSHQQQGQTNNRKNREELTEYVVTRWYRAPEIMLNCLQYTEAIDVWAVGCIFAEMLLREPLFPGNDYIHQLKLIIKFLGTPKQEDIEFVKNVKALRFLTKLPISKPKKWRDVFAAGDDVNPQAVDLLSRMLIFNPEKRISVDQALQHPYLATFYDPADVTSASEFDFKFDLPDDKLSKEALIDLLCEDIEQFHPTVPPTANSTSSTTNASNRFFGMGMTASAS